MKRLHMQEMEEEAYAGFKLNSLQIRRSSDKLIEASEAGAEDQYGCPWNLLPDPWCGRKDRKHSYHQHCRKIPGAFENLYIRKQ